MLDQSTALPKIYSNPMVALSHAGLFVSTPSCIYWCDPEDMTLRYKFKYEAFSIKHLCIVGRKLVAADNGSRHMKPSLMEWDLGTREFVKRVEIKSTIVAIYSYWKNRFLVCCEDGSISVWHSEKLSLEEYICAPTQDSLMSSVVIVKVGDSLKLLSCGVHLKVWNME